LISPWGYFSDIKDAASKAVEVMGRIAALVHIFSDKEEKISLASLNSAVQIYDWHAGEFKRLFSSAPELSEAEQDAEAIIDFLVRDVWNQRRKHGSRKMICAIMGRHVRSCVLTTHWNC